MEKIEFTCKTRRIIRSGNSLIMIIPRDYVRKAGLSKGDVVAVAYDNRTLTIVTLPKAEKRTDVELKTD